jgi:hypothetical protein
MGVRRRAVLRTPGPGGGGQPPHHADQRGGDRDVIDAEFTDDE